MSNLIKLVLLVVAAGIFAVVARSMFVASSGPREPKTDLVQVAANDLPEGLLLRDGDFEWRAVPHGTAPSGAIIKGQDAKDLHGALLRHAIAKNAPVTGDDVLASNDPGFLAAILKPGMRAVSVAIDDVSGNAGLIQPGDYVDLLLTQELNQQDVTRDMSVTSETVVQRIRVLAVGSEFQRPKTGAAQFETRNNARTVTLEVTAHRAEVVAVAAKLGSLSLALRSFARTGIAREASGDAIEDTPPPVWAGEISRASRSSRPAPAATAAAPAHTAAPAAEAEVRVFRGSDKTTAPAASTQTSSNWNAGVPPLPPPLPTAAVPVKTASSDALKAAARGVLTAAK
ncbi:MAG TPA: Flp pilus assembly protein CpaB [Paraburkholderia sp.]|jgi:pilus assembly protein CpaB|nr:Flp pilus assembly protein CpaB [Paraburkholderia sp.]